MYVKLRILNFKIFENVKKIKIKNLTEEKQNISVHQSWYSDIPQ